MNAQQFSAYSHLIEKLSEEDLEALLTLDQQPVFKSLAKLMSNIQTSLVDKQFKAMPSGEMGNFSHSDFLTFGNARGQWMLADMVKVLPEVAREYKKRRVAKELQLKS